jgi:hypothetical protein
MEEDEGEGKVEAVYRPKSISVVGEEPRRSVLCTGNDMGVEWVAEVDVSRVGTSSASVAAVDEGVGDAGGERMTVERSSCKLCDWRNGEGVIIVLRRGFGGSGSEGSP